MSLTPWTVRFDSAPHSEGGSALKRSKTVLCGLGRPTRTRTLWSHVAEVRLAERLQGSQPWWRCTFSTAGLVLVVSDSPGFLSGDHFIIKVNSICGALFLTRIQSLQKKRGDWTNVTTDTTDGKAENEKDTRKLTLFFSSFQPCFHGYRTGTLMGLLILINTINLRHLPFLLLFSLYLTASVKCTIASATMSHRVSISMAHSVKLRTGSLATGCHICEAPNLAQMLAPTSPT